MVALSWSGNISSRYTSILGPIHPWCSSTEARGFIAFSSKTKHVSTWGLFTPLELDSAQPGCTSATWDMNPTCAFTIPFGSGCGTPRVHVLHQTEPHGGQRCTKVKRGSSLALSRGGPTVKRGLAPTIHVWHTYDHGTRWKPSAHVQCICGRHSITAVPAVQTSHVLIPAGPYTWPEPRA